MQKGYCIPASQMPTGFSAPGALGSCELEEVAMYVLAFSRERGQFIAVFQDDVLSRFKSSSEKLILKACGGETRFKSCLETLVDLGYLVKDAQGLAPTPLLVESIVEPLV